MTSRLKIRIPNYKNQIEIGGKTISGLESTFSHFELSAIGQISFTQLENCI